MPEESRSVRGGPPRPRRRLLSGAESAAVVVLVGIALLLMGGASLAGYVVANKNRGENPSPSALGGIPKTGSVGEGGSGGAGTTTGATTTGASATDTTGAGATDTTGAGATTTGAGAADTGGTTTGSAGGGTQQLAAGKQVFTTAGCSGCHTLADANANGNVGPNLDQAKPTYELVVQRVTNGKGAMPSFKGQLSEQQIQDVARYVSSVVRGA